jgi:hypothetical protein
MNLILAILVSTVFPTLPAGTDALLVCSKPATPYAYIEVAITKTGGVTQETRIIEVQPTEFFEEELLLLTLNNSVAPTGSYEIRARLIAEGGVPGEWSEAVMYVKPEKLRLRIVPPKRPVGSDGTSP